MKSAKAVGVAGYTILEVMIVLVVTGGLFASVAAMLSGKQATTEFNQAVRDYEAKIQATASDVATGFYSTGTFSCSVSGPGPVTFAPAPVSLPGTNKGCLFLGKMLATGALSTDIFTLAGRQYKPDNITDIETLADASARAVYSPVDITEPYTNKFSMMIKNVYTIPGNVSIGGFGFISELSGANGAGSPDTGSRGVLLYGLTGTTSPNANNRAANAALINAGVTPEPTGVRVCLWDGGNHKGEITVGDNGSQTTTEVTFDNGVSPVC